jgi:hypothetical protein
MQFGLDQNFVYVTESKPEVPKNMDTYEIEKMKTIFNESEC